jgi:hypothetical protein
VSQTGVSVSPYVTPGLGTHALRRASNADNSTEIVELTTTWEKDRSWT